MSKRNQPPPAGTSLTVEDRLERIERLLAEQTRLHVDPGRAYTDSEVCVLLGSISRSTLWRIRKVGLLDTIDLFPGGTQRTTGRAIINYLAEREQAGRVLEFTSTGRKRKTA